MDPVGTLAALVPSACALALAGYALLQRKRMAALRARISDAERVDPLTGLINRRAFEELLGLELERAKRNGHSLALIVADVDALRVLNARHGHDAGDAVIQEVAQSCLKWKRRIDHAARLGGEEFALLLPETDARAALLVAERMRRAAHRAFTDAPVEATLSFGVASAPVHAEDGAGLLRAADLATSAAKELGGDRSVSYSDEIERTLGDERRTESDEELQLATVIALAEALDIRDTGNGEHSQTVGHYAELAARELGFDEEHVERVRIAGVLHDIGKIGVSDGVLTKPGPLDASEWKEVRTHPEIGARLLSRPEFDDIRGWILAHHERPDGLGYPHGLAGDEIPMEARILAVADAYQAMTAERVYRSALGDSAARAELRAGAGTQFDPAVVDVFLRVLEASRPRRLTQVA